LLSTSLGTQLTSLDLVLRHRSIIGSHCHFPSIVSFGRSLPFSNPDFLYELKDDGFRSMVHVEHGRCKLLSRNGNEFKTFAVLNTAIATEIKTSSVIDGEIVCLDDKGKPQFRDLLFHRGEPRFIAFDILQCDGEDLRYLPLIDRKRRLRSVLTERSDRNVLRPR
jgi:ATP-dependent DNA ligase